MDGKRGNLLLVEDEDLLRRLIAEFLRGEGYAVIEAADGLQATDHFAGHGPFDLVLLDLNLPLLSGVEVCRRIKGQRPHQPVLICSAAILDSHIAALRALDVDQFLSKPYHPLELLDRIARASVRNGHRATDEAAPAIPAPVGWKATARGAMSLRGDPGQAAAIGLR
jgi:DNA-binding response OmpR family regulator